MADIIDYRILGDDMQMVEIELDPQEGVRAEVGGMLVGFRNPCLAVKACSFK